LINTVLTVTSTIVVMTVLYAHIWHRGLNDIVIRLETDNAVSTGSIQIRYLLTSQRFPRFPAVAFFQQQEVTQASIQPGEMKCSSGPRNDHSIQCSSLSVYEALRTVSCDCGDSWPSLESVKRGVHTANWLAKNTSYYPMVPGPSTISKGAGHFLEMQIFFTCKCYW